MLLIALCATGVFLARFQNAARSDGRVDPVTGAVQTAVSPVARVAGNTVRSTGDFLFGFTRARRLAVENRRLHDRLAAMALYGESVSRMQRDLNALRKTMGLRPVPGNIKVPAEILAYIPRDNRLTIGAGSAKGVRPGQPVVSGVGMIGTVQSVSKDRAQVLLLTSRALTIGAIVMNRNPSPAGLLRGENSNTLSLSFNDPKAPVQIGDNVATSGLSEHIPRGISIGKVIQVHDDIAFGQRIAIVDPYFSIGELREVVVLR
ncbi:MAG TPA: rod shape-determining protein MreC [Fimbriimonas sp.]